MPKASDLKVAILMLNWAGAEVTRLNRAVNETENPALLAFYLGMAVGIREATNRLQKIVLDER